MDHVKQQSIPVLSPELRAKVFARMEILPKFLSWNHHEQKPNQAEVHQIKLVCKQFRDIHASHSGLVQRLYLSNDFSVTSLPSLLAWLQSNKSSLKAFVSANPLVDAVLAALVSCRPSMYMTEVSHTSACTLSLISTFTCLEKCLLWHLSAEHLDLAPLGSLPSLKYLRIQGSFEKPHHLAGLTRFECQSAEVLDVQAFVPTLQHLVVVESCLFGLQPQGLSGCTALTHLELRAADITNNNEEVYLNSDLHVVPSNIGLLTRLHTLDIAVGSDLDGLPVANLPWSSSLTSLQDLNIVFRSSRGEMLQHASLLTKLTHLYIAATSLVGEVSVLNMNIEWCRLQALRRLSICDVDLELGDGIAGLLQLHRLREICFSGCTSAGPENSARFAGFMYNLGKICPEIKVEFKWL